MYFVSKILCSIAPCSFLGRNEFGQLGHGDKERRDLPTLIENLQELNIVDAACGRNHSLVLSGK